SVEAVLLVREAEPVTELVDCGGADAVLTHALGVRADGAPLLEGEVERDAVLDSGQMTAQPRGERAHVFDVDADAVDRGLHVLEARLPAREAEDAIVRERHVRERLAPGFLDGATGDVAILLRRGL